MISISSKTTKIYDITLTDKDKSYLVKNIGTIIVNNPKADFFFNIKSEDASLTEEELEELMSLNVPMELNFVNVKKVVGKKGETLSDPVGVDKEVEEAIELKEEVEIFAEEGIVFKKTIRSGQEKKFSKSVILTENINETAKVISMSSLVLLKNNYGKIILDGGSLLITPSNNYGEIIVNDMDISEYLRDNEEIANSSRVLIERDDTEIKYEIYS